MSDQAAITSGQDAAFTHETGWQPAPGTSAALLTGIVYCWWLLIGGVFEILGGGMYLGSAEEAAVHASTPVIGLVYVLTGMFMVSLGFGILRLERWVWYAGILLSLALAALSVTEVVRRVNGATVSNETVFFAGLNVLFCLYNIYFLFVPGTRQALHFRAFRGSPFSPGIALCGIVLLIPALALTLFVNHINKDLSNPVLVLVYLLGFIVMIVMAFMALKLQRWVWWGSWVWALLLVGLSIDVIVRQLNAKHVDVEGIIFSAANILVLASVVYYLVMHAVREAVFRERAKQAPFSPPTLIAGFLISLVALAIYLLAGDLGKLPVTYAVFGIVIGVVVGLLPGADPTNRLMGFTVGLLLAFVSFVIRGGFLPYTKAAAAIVVTVMLLAITGITALFRSRTWFVAMLLGAGTLYALAEPLFQAAPSGYLAEAGLACVAILLGFGVGYAVSSLFGLELVPFTKEAQAAPALASATAASDATSDKASHTHERAEAATGSATTSEKAGDADQQAKATAVSGKAPNGDKHLAGTGATSASDDTRDDDTQQRGGTQ